MTSTGRLLAGSVKDKNGLAQGLRDVLNAYVKLPKAERLARSVEGEEKPVPAPPTGGLVLTIYDRPLGRSEQGQYRLPEGTDMGGLRTEAPHGQRSSLWLTEGEFKSLIPPSLRKGESHSVPAKLAKRIWLYGMWPQTLWVVEQTWQPNSVRAGNLKFTVEDISAQTARMRVEGTVLLTASNPLKLYPTGKVLKMVENRYDARLHGVLVYDRINKKIVTWDMVALGDYAGCWFAGHKGWIEAKPQTPLSVGFAFEVDSSAYQVPAERRRPRSFVHAYIFNGREQFYWDPEKWEEDWKKRQGLLKHK
jgi:hypothetical protein